MTRRMRRKSRGALVTVHRRNGESLRGVVASWTRLGVSVQRASVEAGGALVELDIVYAFVPAEHVDFVTIDREGVAAS